MALHSGYLLARLNQFGHMKRRDLQNECESPESKIAPYEDMNSKQLQITGEKFPQVTLGMCDRCHWCYSSINNRGVVSTCPVCGYKISEIPLNIDEVCEIRFDEKSGLSIKFDRRLPLR